MKQHLLSILLAAFTAANAPAANAPAQTPPPPAPAGSTVVHFTNGTSVASVGIRRSGAQIAVTAQLGGAGRSETLYPIANVKSIDFPKPKAITTAEENLAANKPGDALSTISTLVRQQSDFQGIPGNWYAPATVLMIKALVALGRYDDAEKAINSLAGSADPEELRAAKVQMALGWAKQGHLDKAQAVFDEVIAQGTSAGPLAMAWVGKGNALLASKDYDSALIAFLRVPVFYSKDKEALPPALLGSARAYLRIGEKDKGIATLKQILSKYPNSPAAAEAKIELRDFSDTPATGSHPS